MIENWVLLDLNSKFSRGRSVNRIIGDGRGLQRKDLMQLVIAS